eukprot:gnl/TRDRNA2_/TRDRNA2_37737_c0_seq1.p1 gnl/TRDRNA2_/TRDRNA2_37737_c0~~gnl/TRDRNA2_/TRDRNA2_37737_c0_seq1.p1  ORF type:complete len:565 (+),score=133.43 gnl/TRDRNA2_/TRDRNA2_37737_c0_seq1:111-1805(+)
MANVGPLKGSAVKRKGKLDQLRNLDLEEYADNPHAAALQQGDDDEQDDLQALTNMERPAWLDTIFALSGVTNLEYNIQKEREKIMDQYYQHPYPAIHSIVMNMNFEVFVAAVIMLNSMTIGWQVSIPPGELEGFFDAVEHLFTAFFVVEWCMRMIAFRWVWFFEVQNMADSSLVFFTGVLPKWILSPLGVQLTWIRMVTCLRVLRLIRLARAVRLVNGFKEMWILLHGLQVSLRPLLWTAMIAGVIMYVFSVLGTEIIGKADVFADNDFCGDYAGAFEAGHLPAGPQDMFGTLMKSMFTMVQLMTMDKWADTVARPIMSCNFGLAFFFVGFVSLGVFVVLNLVTAIIVENAFTIAMEDAESQAKDMEIQKKTELKVLAQLFLEIDKDGSGTLTTEEFDSALKMPKVHRLLQSMEMNVEELREAWTILDDGDGQLTVKEFTSGLRRMKGEAKSKDVIDVIRRLHVTAKSSRDLQRQADTFCYTIGSLEEDVNRMSQDTSEVLALLHEMYHRLQVHIERGERQDKMEQRKKAAEAKRAAKRALLQGSGDDDDEDGEDGGDDDDDDD